ncbi:MAG TPA: chemotaxis protein CheW [Gemmatimonadales bacterium]
MDSTGTNLQTPPLTPDDGGEHAGPRILTFEAAGRTHACELEGVREILVGRAATRLPGAPAHVVGLVNLRGTLMTVIDVAARLAPGTPARSGGHVIVVEVEGRLAGCRVDAVRRVRPRPDLDPPHTNGNGAHSAGGAAEGNADGGGVVMGIGEVDGELVAVLDLRAIVRQTLLFPGER